MRRIVAPIRDATAAFFRIEPQDGAAERVTKVASAAGRRSIYALADYWLMALSILLVVSLKAATFDFLAIFLALWAFDAAVAGAFVAFWKRTGHDLSLGEDFRRAVDVIATKSRFAGCVAIGAVLLQATFWSGPEQVVIFFRKELRSGSGMLAALLALTALQALVWAFVYSLGYDTVSDAIGYLRGTR